MKKLLGFLLLSSFIFTSCKREYAFVQPAQVDIFVQKQRVRTPNQDANPILTLLETKEVTPAEIVMDEIIPEASLLVIENYLPQNQKQVQRRQGGTFMEKLFPNQQVKETQKRPVKNKKKKPFKRWGTMIPSGFIFLGIAILLSLININGLALLFGVAAILFLFLGFKKLLRRKRRRDIFR
ncbi:MAG: hypothetical protein ACJA1O_003711 [Spirosomataceae bacterium]|jgi:hypothetical protein